MNPTYLLLMIVDLFWNQTSQVGFLVVTKKKATRPIYLYRSLIKSLLILWELFKYDEGLGNAIH
jgi:hypothetical protein